MVLTVDSFWSVVRPTPSPIKGLEVFNVAVESLLGEFAAIFLQTKVGKNSKPKPVGVGHAEAAVS